MDHFWLKELKGRHLMGQPHFYVQKSTAFCGAVRCAFYSVYSVLHSKRNPVTKMNGFFYYDNSIIPTDTKKMSKIAIGARYLNEKIHA